MAGFFKSLISKFSGKPDIDWDELEAALEDLKKREEMAKG